ncbi:MAG: HlyD family efflux transporter periplasmic adaptor subunit [Thermoanaerobaculia bacterium]|nr:HlyD family efflux transporter periplasmic adaptor subunit [Thermoanaerobaculia bacterium]
MAIAIEEQPRVSKLSIPFEQTQRSLEGGSSVSRLAVPIVLVTLVGLWIAWFFLASVGVVLTTNDARFESRAPLHRVESPIAGVVSEVFGTLGDTMDRGEVLLKLDPRTAELELAEVQAEAEGWRRRQASLRVHPASADEDGVDLAEATAEMQRLGIRVQSLELLLERHTVRTPVAGTLAELAQITPGRHLEAGAWIAAILPDGHPHIVANYPADPALGQILVDQPARVALHGAGRSASSALDAVVRRVARDSTSGALRVELELLDPTNPPIAHGVPATVDIEVARLSPARLLVRDLSARRAP